MKLSTSSLAHQAQDGWEKRCLNSELWHACAGPLVSLPAVGSRVVYFPQGHSEQVAASTHKEVGHVPNYPSLPPQLICQLHNVTMHADVETDEVYAQMTLQPLSPQEQKDTYIPAELGILSNQPTNYFCKILTASDTSTHGGFSVPRRAAEKVFPPLDFSQQLPVQELIARDLHEVEWKFRHIFRGQPKRHLLTTGWSVFVSAKRLVAGDSILFIWNENNQLLLGIRRANRPQNAMPSSVLSSDSMHIGLLAAAAHAASTNSRFTIFYNPRASPSEFVISLSKYVKAVFHTRVSVGMRFRMLFETEESSVRRYMGTIIGISDLDPVRWPKSHWRFVKVRWDESMAGERQPRVSLWEIVPLTTFPMYPSLFPLSLKRSWHPGVPSFHDEGNVLTWLRGDTAEQGLQSLNFRALGMTPWMQQSLDPSLQVNGHDQYQAMAAAALHDIRNGDSLRQQFLSFQQPFQSTQAMAAAALRETRNGDSLRQQFLSFQQPFQSPQQFRPNLLLQQQFIQQTQPEQTLHAQTHCVTENQNRNHLLPQQLMQPFNDQQKQQQQQLQQHTHQETFQISNNQFQHLQSPLPSLLCQESVFPDPNATVSSVPIPICVQKMLCSLGQEGSFNLLDKRHPQTWVPPFTTSQVNSFVNTVSFPPFPWKDGRMEPQNDNVDSQTRTLFGVNINSSSILPNQEPNLGTIEINTDVSTMPFAASGIQNSLYGFDDSSGLLQSGQVDPETKTFVKAYKSGSVGRSLDITRFSSYLELCEELGQMFGIEGQLEDPLRSGWQLVFVDRENDVLRLGDAPWEVFVNHVWYIKILSPEDVQKLGKQDI